MKRYWKLITVATFIVLTIGTLYIQASFAKSAYPEFVIEHKSGNQAEVKPLTIMGDYEANEENYIRMEISDQGTLNRDNKSSTLYLLKGDYLPPEIQRLQKDYRNFMRGKVEQLELFFKDQNALAYVDLKSEYLFTHDRQWSYSFEIDILDRESENRTKMELVVPEEEKYAYLNIRGIQIINDELKIITENELTTIAEQSHHAEMHIYTVDLHKQKIVSDDVIDMTDITLETDQWIDMNAVNRDKVTDPNKYVAFTIEKSEETILEDGYDSQVLDRQFIVYNLETNEQERIELPEEYGEEVYPELQSGTMIYFSKEKEGQIEIISYDLENQQIETKQTFDKPNVEEDLPVFHTLANDKIYIVHQLYNGKVDASIMIGDVKTGEILYEGSVELADSSKDQQVNQMHINEISVMKE